MRSHDVLLSIALFGLPTARGFYSYGGGWGWSSWYSSCSSCSAECIAKNEKELAKTPSGSICDEWSYTDEGWGSYPPWCNPACNNAECNRQNNNCPMEAALQACKETDSGVKALKKAPRRYSNHDGSFNASMKLRFGQLKLETTNPPDPTYVTFPIEYELQWKDFRWSQVPSSLPPNSTVIACRDVAPALLKIPTTVQWNSDIGTQESLEELYFLPKLIATNKKEPVEFTYKTMAFEESTFTVTTKSKLTPAFSQLDYETDTPYYAFPFDVHELYARLESKPALKLTGCEGEWLLSRDSGGSGGTIDADGKIDLAKLGTLSKAEVDKILPASGDWVWDQEEAKGPQIMAFHELDAGGDSNEKTCVIRFRVRRNPLVYTLKAFVPDMIVMCIGMASLFINPAIPPLFGGRCSMLIIAMLITMSASLNRNNGLGKLSYLLKIDFVAILNLAMLLLAMGCSVVVHLCFRFEKIRLAVLLDRAVRFTLPSLIFPGVQIFEYMFLANDDSSGPVTFLIVWLIVALTLVSTYFTLKYLKGERELRLMAKKLSKLKLDDPNTNKLLQQAFVLFDADKSGALDAKEGRKLLRMVNPGLGRQVVAQAIREADSTGNGILEDDFHEMINRWALGSIDPPVPKAKGEPLPPPADKDITA